MRIMFAAAFAAAFAFSFTPGAPAVAAKKPLNKMCMATGLDGKAQSFKCSATEKCCFNYLANKGTCVAATATCL
jgi:hypothetical protein